MATPNRAFIVKVQVPLFASDPDEMGLCLVYDESRKIQQQLPITPQIKRYMKGEPKAFFFASRNGKELVIHGIAPWQNW